MKCFKQIDMYGPIFTFTVFHSRHYKTIIGGILTIISIILILLLCFLSGKDFFFKENPKVLISNEKPTKYTIFNLTQNDLLLAWRINDINGNEVNLTGKLYPIFYYFSIERSSISRKIISSNRINLKYSKCNYTRRSELDWLSDLNDYYCVDFSNLSFGGASENSFFYYFSIYISYCENGINYNESKCSSLNDLNSFIDNQWEFELIYPEYYFQPNDLSKPLKISYSSYQQTLTKNLQKKDVFTFQNVQFKDDKGILFSDITNTNVIALSSYTSDYFLVEDENLVSEGKNSFIYYCDFYMSKDFIQYSRSYLKIQDIIAVSTSIIKIVIIIFEFISNFYGTAEREMKIIKSFINFDKEKKQQMIKKIHIPKICNTLIINKSKQFSKNPDSFFSYSKISQNSGSGNNILKLNNISSSSFDNFDNEIKNEIRISKTMVFNLSHNELIKEKKIDISNIQYKNFQKIIANKSLFHYNPGQTKYNHGFLFKFYAFGNLDCLRNDKNYKIYKKAKKYIERLFDISYYIQIIKELKFLESIILEEEYRKLALQFLKNPNIHNEKELNFFYGNIYQDQELFNFDIIVNKFKELRDIEYGFKVNNTNKKLDVVINDIDNKIISFLDNDIQNKIEQK